MIQRTHQAENAVILVILGCSANCLSFLGLKINPTVSSVGFVPCRKNFIFNPFRHGNLYIGSDSGTDSTYTLFTFLAITFDDYNIFLIFF